MLVGTCHIFNFVQKTDAFTIPAEIDDEWMKQTTVCAKNWTFGATLKGHCTGLTIAENCKDAFSMDLQTADGVHELHMKKSKGAKLWIDGHP